MSQDRNHRNKNPRKDLIVTDMPTDIRKALVANAKEQNIPVSEAAVRILCDTFKVKYVPPVNGLRGHQ